MLLLDREEHLAGLGELLDTVRRGESAVLVLRGEPGVGITALFEQAIEMGGDMRLIPIAGVESEKGLAFAAVHRLCRPLLDRLDRLPKPQRDAVSAALGLSSGPPQDLFLVALGVLTLLSDAAEEGPLLCIVDDAHWLDEASLTILAFVARRLLAESIAMIFAVHEPTEHRVPLEGLPELRVEGLDDVSAQELLATHVAGPLDGHVRDRIVKEVAGNPLALSELCRQLTAEQFAGTLPLPEALPIGSHLEEELLRHVRLMPAETQALMLLAAAEPTGDSALLMRAAKGLGIPSDAAGPAQSAELMTFDPVTAFRSPLIRSAVYGAASAADRQRMHRALAEATAAESDPDRRAYHRAAAASGPDEEIAAELERSAEIVERRGSYAAAGDLMQRAASLTLDASIRCGRILAAGRLELAAGAAGRATALLAEASALGCDDIGQAEALRLRGSIGLALGEGDESSAMFLEAARTLEVLDVRKSRDAYLEAIEAAMHSGPLGNGLVTAAKAALTAPSIGKGRPSAADGLLAGFTALFTDGHAAAKPQLRIAVDSLQTDPERRWLSMGCVAAMAMWDDEALHALCALQTRLARETGTLIALGMALLQEGVLDDILAGRLGTAGDRFAEATEISSAVGHPGFEDQSAPFRLVLSSWRGRAEETRELAETVRRQAIERGHARWLAVADWSTAILEIGLGGYETALSAARTASEDQTVWLGRAALPELVEAAVRTGERSLALVSVEQLAESTLASGSELALGTLARTRAILADGDEADDLYQEAIERLRHCRAVPYLARAHLLYGEWLRRERRQRDARRHLRSASDIFVSIGAEAFAERARHELEATGERTRSRTVVSLEALTPQETNIARLAAEGSSNPEIAAQLFISRRTVEYHLSKVFTKLGLSSRTQLAKALVDMERV